MISDSSRVSLYAKMAIIVPEDVFCFLTGSIRRRSALISSSFAIIEEINSLLAILVAWDS